MLEGELCAELLETIVSLIGPDFDASQIKYLELMPKLLLELSKVKSLKTSTKLGKRPLQVTGAEYRDLIISSLFQLEWPVPAIVAMITNLREFQLSDNHLDGMIKKIALESRRLSLQDVPSLVYQVRVGSVRERGVVCACVRICWYLFAGRVGVPGGLLHGMSELCLT